MSAARSLRVAAGTARPRVRLVCFPHAGGAANFFLPWRAFLPDDVELVVVQYPGRQDRFGDPLVAGMDELVRDSLPDLDRLGDLPAVFLGHSMGASVAFESVRLLAWEPALLVVSARPAPGVGGTRPSQSDEEMLAELARLGGLQEEVLAHPELRAVVLPILRADCGLIHSYRPDPHARTAVEIMGAVGDADPEVAVVDVGAWQGSTTGGFSLEVFSGGHFYLDEHARALAGRALRRIGVKRPS